VDCEIAEQAFEPPQVSFRPQQQVNLVAVREEAADEVGADEAASTRDQDALGQSPKASYPKCFSR